MSDNNIAPKSSVSDIDYKALKAAKKLEEKRLNDGWRYVQATPTLQILVPCKKDGKPTEEGMRRIYMVVNR